MGLDIRTPMGLMFSILGLVLTIFGLTSGPEIYNAHSLGININLTWGIFVLAFGVVMLLLAFAGKGKNSD